MSASALWDAGPHHGLVWRHGAALIDGAVPLDLAVAVWSSLQHCADLAEFFGLLSAGTGRGLLDLPDFAVALRVPAGAHLAARGAFEVRAGTIDGVSGAGVITWLEKRTEATSPATLSASGTAPEGSTQSRPVALGLVPAAILVVPLVDGPVRSPEVSNVPAQDASEGPAAQAPADPQDAPASPSPAVPEDRSDDVLENPPASDAPDSDEPVKPQPETGEFGHLWSDHTFIPPVEEAAIRGPAPKVPQADEHSPVDDIAPPDAELADAEMADAEMADAELSDAAPGANAGAKLDETWGDSVEEPVDKPVEKPVQDPIERGVGLFVSSVPKPTPSPPSVERSKAPAALPPAANEHGPSVAQDPDVERGDHDGHTVLSLPDAEVAGPPREDDETPTLQGVLCSRGHANPTHRAVCRLCAEPLAGPTVRVNSPSLGRLAASTGEVIELTGPVVVGRDPRAARFHGPAIPRLLAIPQPHVSASHVEIRLEGWTVLAVDLKSTNGTFLRRHSDPPVRLPEAPQLLVADDVLDLGHGVHLTFTGLP